MHHCLPGMVIIMPWRACRFEMTSLKHLGVLDETALHDVGMKQGEFRRLLNARQQLQQTLYREP
jgi:hypothetical protein